MEMTRREFAKGGLASLGFLALPGGLFAPLLGHPLRGQPSAGGYAPAGWKPKKKPNLVFGAVSDTHVRTDYDGVSRCWRFSLKYFRGALEWFKASNADAVVHGGDFAHRGMAASMRFHVEEWREVFGKSGGPVKLFVSGNHDIEGWWYSDFGTGIFPDKNVRAKYILGADTAAKWEEIWGEKYEPVWHREVNGYHFVGQHWGEESADNPKGSGYGEIEMAKFLDEHSGEPWMEPGAKPFFVVRHVAPQRVLCAALVKHPNAITLYGHAHGSAARWNMVRLHGGNAVIEMSACDARGDNLGLAGTLPIAKAKPEGEKAAGYPRSAYLLRVYDDMLVVERREFGEHGGSLGPDWVIPLGANMRDSFTLEARKAAIGNPEFPKGAKLEVSLDRINKIDKIENRGRGLRDNNPDNPVNPVKKEPALRVKIPNANGNPQSRVYAYEVVVVGDDPKARLFKCVFAEGMNLGYGHEPNHGITMLEIPGDQLPAGKKLTIGVRPLSSLGTKGKTISTTFRV